jgi:hypothetical protein
MFTGNSAGGTGNSAGGAPNAAPGVQSVDKQPQNRAPYNELRQDKPAPTSQAPGRPHRTRQ